MRRLGQAGLGVVLGLMVAEGAFWLRDSGAFPHLNVYEADPAMGARLRPGATQRVSFAGNPVSSVRINAQGYRGADWGPAEDKETVVIGDSQVFGLGVEEDQTFSAQLAASTGAVVRNAGTPTWGPTEFLLAIDELAESRSPERIVLVLNLANDLFELERKNVDRHVIWDGWAVRAETAPAAMVNFPGRQWLFSKSHAVYALRRAMAEPLPESHPGFSSEGSWADLTHAGERGLASVGEREQVQTVVEPQKQARVPGPAQEQVAAVAQAQAMIAGTPVDPREAAATRREQAEYELQQLSQWVAPLTRDEEQAVQAAEQRAHPGDIVYDNYSEAARPITVTAEMLRLGSRLRKSQVPRLEEWLAKNPNHEKAGEVRKELAARAAAIAELDALSGTLGEPTADTPTRAFLRDARDRARKAGAELAVLVLPLDVQVSETEWAKYGVPPQDMSETRGLATELVATAEALGMRALDATAALEAALPGAFLHGDLHMTPKGHKAVAAALAAKLAEPPPLAVPPLGLAPGRSRAPSPTEAAYAPEITVKGSTRNKCSTRQVREWLILDCAKLDLSELVGTRMPSARFRDLWRISGPLELARIDTSEHYGPYAIPLLAGRDADYGVRFRDRVERLEVRWQGTERTISFNPEVSPAAPEVSCSAGRGGSPAIPACPGSDCAAETACVSGNAGPTLNCAPGTARAGGTDRCYALCDATRTCAEGDCVDWNGAGVCL